MSKKFITKDSGVRKEFTSGMKRDLQEGKPRFDLINPLDLPYDETILYRWAMLMMRGAEKYGYRNWEKANSIEEFERFKASAERHFRQFMDGETDEDHLSAVFFNLNAVNYLMWKLNCDVKGKKNPINIMKEKNV